ncbi:uncharacterized protein KIAA0825 homolog isoform X2 [Thalassophryne amazonica]|uniref:uncharacterized protein KIAA0825 homolog isoform X2 n=1 Tax=Thalassophryne amazonica TaxID=390379 RepID=UPI001470B0E1|nr:uncharacterized protein KIAA0825 homolog isoform X2 [Thalassophryne amazonica]
MECSRDSPDDHACVELLVPCASQELDDEQFLKETEQILKFSNHRSEHQLKGFQAKMTQPCAGDCSLSPLGCRQCFNLRMDNMKLITTGHQEVMGFLRAMQQFLRSDKVGKEELTLQLLLNVSAQCGVRFPCIPTSFSSFSSLPPHQSVSSNHLIHAVKDDSSLEFQEAWDDVRFQLRRHLLDRLSSYSPCPGHISTLSIPERVYCLQQLCFLYPESQVVTYYQGRRTQTVLALLHSALSPSLDGETGVDRLVMGFCSVIPHLTRSFREDLDVLARITETHNILGFLNEAYLNTVARELSSAIERECERALKDSTTFIKKIRKYSARSKTTVAPLELLVNSGTFSLTSSQLEAFMKLICILLEFENNVKELFTDMTCKNCTGDKGITEDTADGEKSRSHVLLHTAEAQDLEFDWRLAFRGLAPQMAHWVKVVLDDVCAKNLQEEETLRASGHTFVTLSHTTGHTTLAIPVSNAYLREHFLCSYSEREIPKMIAKFCDVIMAELDALLPLAVACRHTSLLEVQSSYVEACGSAVFAILDRVQQRALEIPSSAPLKNLPALLATSIHVYQRLKHYNARLKDSAITSVKVPLTLLLIQKCSDIVEALKDQLTSYCVQVCSISILQDAESHNWADTKPFYEGERCSFSVQMWFYFLCGLRRDLWAVLPPDLAKDMLGQVLLETLQLLVQRYERARPSYKRHLQIRSDITAVLLYVENLMWSICDHPEALMHFEPASGMPAVVGGSKRMCQIHCLCNQLLIVMVIITAPLSLLYRTFVVNSVKEATSRQPDSTIKHWLNAINPYLFTEHVIRDGLTGQAASVCQLRLLTSDAGSISTLLLRLLLDRDCHLPRMLLENSRYCKESNLEMSTELLKGDDDFIIALFNVFSHLNSVPKALTEALQPYLDSAHVWQHFYTLSDTTQAVPAVIRCVRAIVVTATNSLLVHLVSMVMSLKATEPRGVLFRQDVPESVLDKVPKEWNYTPPKEQGRDNKNDISLAIQALLFIFTNLPLAVEMLPLPIRFLFQEAEKHLSQHDQQLRFRGLLLWALLGCLIQSLEDPDTLEQISGFAPDCDAKDRLALLADCLQTAMDIQQKRIPKPTVHEVLQALEKKRPKCMDTQLQKARKLCVESVFEQEGESRVAAAELTEQKISLMLLEVCHKAGGSDYLRQIYHIIQGNEQLLMSKLCGSAQSPSDSDFDIGSDNHVDTLCFNPLHEFDHVGKDKLDQSAVVDWAWDWPMLLPTYQGMSLVTFRTLLVNSSSTSHSSHACQRPLRAERDRQKKYLHELSHRAEVSPLR